jgi:hypothetical protein
MNASGRESKVFITTADTGKTYTFPPVEGVENPQLWEVKISIHSVSSRGNTDSGYSSAEREIFVERQKLVDHGLLPVSTDDKPKPIPAPTAEDLILSLLDLVGVHPE